MQLKPVPLQLNSRTGEIVGEIFESLKKCASMKLLKQVHAPIITSGLHHENYLSVKLLSLSTKVLANIDYARKIFDCSMGTANVFLWTAMITAYSRNQSQATVEAILIYKKMQRHMIEPNSYTLSSVLKACSILSAVQEGNQIHVHALKLGLNTNIYVQTTLMDMYAKFGCIEAAVHLFETSCERNLVMCNAMIMCYGKAGNVEAAREIFDKMTQRDSISWTSMISSYTNHGNMQAAQELFDQMCLRDVSCWNALIRGYAHSGDGERALLLFNEMKLENVEPNQVTMAVIISVCGCIGALEKGKQIHEYIKDCSGMEMNIYMFNALIDMYAKCGSLDDAYRVFCEMPYKDVVTYNAMILGFAKHGHAEDSLKLFSELLVGGLKPDAVTLLGILTACSHAGLLGMGNEWFSCMTRDYKIEPSVDHYACMVDLLGRAGFIEEAYQLIKTMKLEPHAGVWGALLRACKTCCNIEIGEIAARKLFIVEPENPANYVLLSNIYARSNRWDDVAKVRHWMSKRGIAKASGYSWIEVDKLVHKFLAGDTSHPQYRHIHATLKNLSLQLILDYGYGPS
uniref:Pentatricopeptide repeat-containing protein At2g13600-like n=1 Tax=Nelumbo nucifera TaxID=4432 RepID=A0A822YT93_NELNU|nr:TPA_asm: hypothetical protein HUJ06_007985 [Nelumbo nucifera]